MENRPHRFRFTIWKHLIIGLLVASLPAIAQARMTPLGDTQLEAVSGQSGIELFAQALGLEIEGDTLYYHDDDGVAAGDTGAYLSFCGIRYEGRVTYGSPLLIDQGRFTPIIGDGISGDDSISGLNILIDDMTIRIDSMEIEAIRVGSAAGTGLSFGAIGMRGLEAQISGQVQIYYH